MICIRGQAQKARLRTANIRRSGRRRAWTRLTLRDRSLPTPAAQVAADLFGMITLDGNLDEADPIRSICHATIDVDRGRTTSHADYAGDRGAAYLDPGASRSPHNNQMSEFQADETFSSALIDQVVMMPFWQDGGGAGGHGDDGRAPRRRPGCTDRARQIPGEGRKHDHYRNNPQATDCARHAA
jgi:hypothetical protein